MKKVYVSTIVCTIAIIILGCNNNARNPSEGIIESENTSSVDNVSENEEQVIHTELNYYNFDKVCDLTSFFDSIIDKHGTMLFDYNQDGHHNDELKKCIAQIDMYRKGNQKYFPDKLVGDCISILGEQCAQTINHYTSVDLTFSEWFMMCAAYYTPDITCLVETQTPDHNAGYYNFGSSYNGNPWWSYLFIKRSERFEVFRVNEDFVFLTGVYQLEDEAKRKYYLFSNNQSTSWFRQELYSVNNQEIVKIASLKKFPFDNNQTATSVYFDKDNLVWLQCTSNEDSEILQPVNELEKVRLILNGKNSKFSVLK